MAPVGRGRTLKPAITLDVSPKFPVDETLPLKTPVRKALARTAGLDWGHPLSPMSTVTAIHPSPGSETYPDSSVRGMERGFALSPMADLLRDYTSSSDSELSLFRRVTTLASKASFDVSEIFDRGTSVESSRQDPGLARFCLETGFLIRTERTMREMQETLSQAASLVEGRKSCFCIDPHRILVTVLRNANSLNKLQVSWSALTERLNLAHRNFEKYQREFQALPEDEPILSPVSTQPELYSVFPREATPASNVDYLYAEIPHHRKQRPKGYAPHTDMVHDHIEVPGYLQRAFPDCLPEIRPSTVYYSMEGERRENTLPANSSYRSADEFVTPSMSGASKGKNRATSRTPPPTVEEVEDEDDIRDRNRKVDQP
ncbi:hypothetical protein K438DRAFT_1781049 [Mycena galopus ATCC 62051]|nr:hypothetical protein K438DRAFT_1781049 [Mycena galopus ATCC 62051]